MSPWALCVVAVVGLAVAAVASADDLHAAAARGDTAAVQALLGQGLDRNGPDARGNSPTANAAASCAPGATQVIALLIARGVRVDAPNRANETPLYQAARSRCPDAPAIVGLLLSGGADPNAQSGFTNPLSIAAADGEPIPLLALLLRHGAFDDARVMFQGTSFAAIERAAAQGKTTSAAFLIAYGATTESGRASARAVTRRFQQLPYGNPVRAHYGPLISLLGDTDRGIHGRAIDVIAADYAERAYRATGRKGPEVALAWVKAALRAHPDAIWWRWAAIRIANAVPSGALVVPAASRHAQNEGLARLASRAAGANAEATAAFRASVTLAPWRQAPYEDLARVEVDTGDWRAAARNLRSAVYVAPGAPAAARLRAHARLIEAVEGKEAQTVSLVYLLNHRYRGPFRPAQWCHVAGVPGRTLCSAAEGFSGEWVGRDPTPATVRFSLAGPRHTTIRMTTTATAPLCGRLGAGDDLRALRWTVCGTPDQPAHVSLFVESGNHPEIAIGWRCLPELAQGPPHETCVWVRFPPRRGGPMFNSAKPQIPKTVYLSPVERGPMP